MLQQLLTTKNGSWPETGADDVLAPPAMSVAPLTRDGRNEGSACPPDDFEALLESVLDVAYRTAYHLARNTADAEDLVQEAALLACRHRTGFQAGTNFKAWFLRILTNAFYSRCRKSGGARRTVSLDEATEAQLYTLAGAGDMGQGLDPAKAFTDRLDAEAIRAAIETLGPEYRVVTAMYLVDDLSYQEIASILDIPVGTVRSRLHRGRRLLQSALWEIAADRGLVA
jgi:RNA polymerase sigma-70 factor, ECF subfamily